MMITESPLLVACLCAQWCGVCRDYRAVFEQVASRFPQLRFVWVDVEDQADLVDPIEVETFPTLLVAAGGQALFFGPLAPQSGTLERIVRDRTGQPDAAVPVLGADVTQLAQRLNERL